MPRIYWIKFVSQKVLHIMLTFFVYCSIATAGTESFSNIMINQFGTSGNDRAYNIVYDAKGNQYITGSTEGDMDGDGPGKNFGGVDVFILKLNKEGKIQWIRQFGSPASDKGHLVALDSYGDIYVIGHTDGDLDGVGDGIHRGYGDPFLLKLDKNGQLKWLSQFGTIENDGGLALAIDSTDKIYVTGFTRGDMNTDIPSSNIGLEDIFVAAFDINGNRQWLTQFGSTKTDFGYALTLDEEKNVYITGFSTGDFDTTTGQGNLGEYDIVVAKTNSEGVLQWTRQFGTAGNDFGYSIAVESENVYVTGFVSGDFDGNGFGIYKGGADILLLKLKISGESIWSRQLGTENTDWGVGVNVDSDENVYVTGTTTGDLDGPESGNHKGGFDIFAIKFSDDGHTEWIQQWGTQANDIGFTITQDNNNQLVIIGQTDGDLDGVGPQIYFGGSDIFKLKIDRDD